MFGEGVLSAVNDGLHAFRTHMAEVARQIRSEPAPAKVLRYVRMFEAGLPLDITVRWYPASAIEAIEARVEELTRREREVWISHGLPWKPGADDLPASVEKRTVLPKHVCSVRDFRSEHRPALQAWDPGAWAKVYHDTPARSLIGGTISFDTNRFDSIMTSDSRTIRLEAAAGISDVRHLQRQMSARKVLVVSSQRTLFSQIKSALEKPKYAVKRVKDIGVAAQAAGRMGPGEPRVVIIDRSDGVAAGVALMDDLKAVENTEGVPMILIVGENESCSLDLRRRVAAVISQPVSADAIRSAVFLTGFRLRGDASGFHQQVEDMRTRNEVERLLGAVMGAGGSYRRMMARVANAEARPTIAFEFKLVPLAPYEFFFIDYEWSGAKHELHRFDWLYSLDAG
jgi:CheY-like chemotaxis protein